MTRHPAPFVRLAHEIEEALVRGRPIVALETTLVAHGFPHPRGLETAIASEDAVRAAGAIPATIAVIDGELRVGLTRAELERIATAPVVRKVGPRDLAPCLADGALGATTVGGTLVVARLCGIRCMATGGIGGAHRGAETTFDISADIGEIAISRSCVVCAGAKSLLDVAKTLELLETLGVPVVGYRTDRFPLFYSAGTTHPVPARADDAAHAARICDLHWSLGRHSGVLVATPPPADLALAPEDAAALMDDALAAAAEAGVRTGQDVTPFVLARVHERSGGRSEELNRALIVANAGLAGQIAAAMGRRG